MKSIHTTVTGLNRLTNTKDGNPRWDVYTQHGTFRTRPDADVAYGELQNLPLPSPVSIQLDQHKQIIHVIDQTACGSNRARENRNA